MNTIADNPFEYSSDNKRYQTYSYYLKKRFGKKVMKIPLNVDLGCPNRDGTKGCGGCKFCSAQKSGEFAGDPQDDILTQFAKVREKMAQKWSQGLYIPYFQAGSNTYAPVERLREMYETALSVENCAGLSIATRADCIDEQKAELLGEIAKRTYLTVELGLQTVHDETALAMNRCHTFEDFLSGYGLLRKNGVNVCVHIINGLPGETHEMMLETARQLSRLELHSIKIHLLHVLKGTELAQMYERGEFEVMGLEEYVETVCDQIELLPKELIIQRVTGDGAKDELVAPLWSLKKFCVMNEIDKELGRRNSYQGIKFAG
ncbi:MAG: TIGR01212 family radical SAM protein [Ruminococcus sp.]|nr:TIGR01212 family radical SAM protein [Ruminococcus sp.]